MKGRTPTKDEKEFMDKVGQLGCIVCRLFHSVHSPPSIHHIDGRTKEGCHYHVLPLCYNHHQGPETREYIGRHTNKKRFESRYGSEQELYHAVLELLKNGD